MCESEFSDITLLDIINTQDVSVRLRNCILCAMEDELFPIKTVEDYLCAGDNVAQTILSLPNMGIKSANELDELIKNVCAGHKSRSVVIKSIHGFSMLDIDSFDSIREFIESIINNVLGNRESIIINGRFSKGEGKKTLNTLGEEVGITRERIRQIEKKAISKINRVLQQYKTGEINTRFISELDKLFFSTNIYISIATATRVISKADKSINIYIQSIFGGLISFLDSTYYHGNKIDGWFKEENDCFQYTEYSNKLNNESLTLEDAISRSQWPIRLDSLIKLTGQPECVLLDQIDNNHSYSAKTINNATYVQVKNAKLKDIMRFILRKHMRAMTLYEIKDECSNMFTRSLSVGQIGNTLASMEDALIVDRGVYNLYENMYISDDDLLLIRSITEDYLLEKQEFISSKVIIRYLRTTNPQGHMLHSLNGYSLLGILQDDNRFNCMRGFMIGLKSRRFQGKYIDLESEIVELMRAMKHPLTLYEIVHELSPRRELLVPSLQNMLDSNVLFELVSKGAYSLVDLQKKDAIIDSQSIDDAILLDWDI